MPSTPPSLFLAPCFPPLSHLVPFSGYDMAFLVVSSEAEITNPSSDLCHYLLESVSSLCSARAHREKVKEGKEKSEGHVQSSREDRK